VSVIEVSSPAEASSCVQLGIKEITKVGKAERGLAASRLDASGKRLEWEFGHFPYETAPDGSFEPTLKSEPPVILTVADKVEIGSVGEACVCVCVCVCVFPY